MRSQHPCQCEIYEVCPQCREQKKKMIEHASNYTATPPPGTDQEVLNTVSKVCQSHYHLGTQRN